MNRSKQQKKTHQIWLSELTHTQQTIASETIPLAAGFLAAYAQKQLGDHVKFSIFKLPEKLIARLEQEQPALIGFTNYVWNFDLSYSIAQKIKEISPQTVVVFGGPNYPLDQQARQEFLKARPVIDFYLYGEGEKAFSRLLASLIKYNFDIDKVKSLAPDNCQYIWQGKLVCGETLPRIDIKGIPSPYLEGLLDEFFDNNFMPLIQTCRGCPFTCAYCCEGQPYYCKISFRDPKIVLQELEYIAQRSKGNKKLNIADSNFGQYANDLQTAKSIARTQDKYDYPHYIHVATGKTNQQQVVKVAKTVKGGLRLAAAVQSTDPKVLKNIKRRNVSLDTLVELAKGANQAGSNTYSEIILALPGDNKQAHFKSIQTMINTGLNYIRCYTLMMLKGSGLNSPAARKQFGLITKFRVLPRCFGSYQFGQEKIKAVEIEEVCVANNTMSFKDYLECRLFALTIELFYNDGILSELLAFLKNFKISPYDLLKKIHDHYDNFPTNLHKLYQAFKKETQDELWDSSKELEKFAKQEATMQKYITGQYGSNLIFKYKSLATIKHISQAHDLAFSMAKELVPKENHDFLDELKQFSLLQKADLLDIDKNFQHQFSYDMEKAVAHDFRIKPSQIKLDKPVLVKFERTPEQAGEIKTHLDQFGTTITGISRILSRIYVKKMYRQINY